MSTEPNQQPQALPPKATPSMILDTTTRVGQEVRKARRELASTDATVKEIYGLLAPSDGEENPVLEALEQVLLALRHQQMTLDSMDARLAQIEQRVGVRRLP